MEKPTRWSPGTKIAAALVGLLLVAAAVVGLGFATLWAFNPMGDEWVCAEGEAPVDALDDRATMTGCVPVDTELPAEHVRWDPLGNRPVPSNCEKDGWRLIERDTRRGDVEQECLNGHLGLPKGWRVVEDA